MRFERAASEVVIGGVCRQTVIHKGKIVVVSIHLRNSEETPDGQDTKYKREHSASSGELFHNDTLLLGSELRTLIRILLNVSAENRYCGFDG